MVRDFFAPNSQLKRLYYLFKLHNRTSAIFQQLHPKICLILHFYFVQIVSTGSEMRVLGVTNLGSGAACPSAQRNTCVAYIVGALVATAAVNAFFDRRWSANNWFVRVGGSSRPFHAQSQHVFAILIRFLCERETEATQHTQETYSHTHFIWPHL